MSIPNDSQLESADLTANSARLPQWVARPELGSARVMRWVVPLALHLGRAPVRLLLYPVCLYFLFFSAPARQASRDYLAHVLGRKPKLADLFRHFHFFASTVLDRIFLLNDRFEEFEVETFGKELVDGMNAHGEGCLLLGAHLGSFEIIRSLGRATRVPPMNLVMYEDNAQKINAVLYAINPQLTQQIIGLGKVDSMLKVEAALERGEFVGMLADRTIREEGVVRRRFLGREAPWPLGPFRIALMLKRPIFLMLGIYRGGKRYEIHFIQLADMRDVPRAERDAAVESAVQNYIAHLESFCRDHPYNWFNFYDFWH